MDYWTFCGLGLGWGWVVDFKPIKTKVVQCPRSLDLGGRDGVRRAMIAEL